MLLNQDDHLSVMGDKPVLMFPVKETLQDLEVNLTPYLDSSSDTAKSSSTLCLNYLYTSPTAEVS